MRRALRPVKKLGGLASLSQDPFQGLNILQIVCLPKDTSRHVASLQSLSRGREGSREWRGFASKAEEYDIISVDSGLARIEGHDAGGFLVNNAYLRGSVICTGNLTALWAIDSLSGVTTDSLALLLLMRPPPDLLVLGCGPKIQPAPQGLQDWLASHGVALECLDTGNAVSTFNILNQEGRTVVAALLPSE